MKGRRLLSVGRLNGMDFVKGGASSTPQKSSGFSGSPAQWMGVYDGAARLVWRGVGSKGLRCFKNLYLGAHNHGDG